MSSVVIFCDASFVQGRVRSGRCWFGLTCPALRLRAGVYGGPAYDSTDAETRAIRWAASWAAARNIAAPLIVNDNQTAVKRAAGEGVRCVWRQSSGNMGNWGLIEAHIIATAARTEHKAGTWAAPTRAQRAADAILAEPR